MLELWSGSRLSKQLKPNPEPETSDIRLLLLKITGKKYELGGRQTYLPNF